MSGPNALISSWADDAQGTRNLKQRAGRHSPGAGRHWTISGGHQHRGELQPDVVSPVAVCRDLSWSERRALHCWSSIKPGRRPAPTGDRHTGVMTAASALGRDCRAPAQVADDGNRRAQADDDRSVKGGMRWGVKETLDLIDQLLEASRDQDLSVTASLSPTMRRFGRPVCPPDWVGASWP
jgi:hypothetical protein